MADSGVGPAGMEQGPMGAGVWRRSRERERVGEKLKETRERKVMEKKKREDRMWGLLHTGIS